MIGPMHIYGGPFRVAASGGDPFLEAVRTLQDPVNIGPGQGYDVIWEAQEPGKWLIHYHINHHTTNNNVEQDGGGVLMVIVEVSA